MDQFLWIPGKGMDGAALERLQSHFPRPSEPMGEAWFMGEERRMYPELLGDLSSVSTFDMQGALAEIASGFSAFGPRDEWSSWYHYLMAQTLPRAHDAFVSPLIESLITGFLAVYPNGIYSSPYKQFRQDVLLTLGRCMMNAACWNGTQIAVGRLLHRSNKNPNRVWCWWDASGDFSSSMFFCLKYLPEELVGNWLRSVLAIPSPHWRAQVLVWAVGAHDILAGSLSWPSEWKVAARPNVSWDWSHCLSAELATKDDSGAVPVNTFLNESVRRDTLTLLRRHFSDDTYLSWLDSISTVPYLETEIAEIPNTFESLYLQRAS